MNLAHVDFANEEEGIRLARRRRLETDVVLRDPDGFGEAVFSCRDISVTGFFVYSTACVKTGSEFICQLPTGDGELVEARGQVSRVVLDPTAPERSGMGIAFTQLNAHARDQLIAMTAA